MAETVKKAKAKPRKTAAKPKVIDGRTAEARAIGHEDIAKLAHRYWAERGFAHGNPEQDWLRAEQELRGKAS